MVSSEPALRGRAGEAEPPSGEMATFVYAPELDRYLFCSEAFDRLHGMALEGLPHGWRTRLELVVDDADRARVAAVLEDALRAERGYEVRYRLAGVRRGREVLETAQCWREPASGALRLLGTVRAVVPSEEISAEGLQERLRAAELRAQRLLAAGDSLLDGLLICDADDRLVYFNRRYAELLPPAFAPGLVLGEKLTDVLRRAAAGGVYHPDMGPNFVEHRLRRRQEGVQDFDVHLIDDRWLRIREHLMPDGGRVLVARDITDRKRALAEVHEREERWRAVAEAVPLPIVIARIAEPEVLFANNLARETFGLQVGTQEEAIRAAYVRPGDRRTVLERLERDGRVDNLEVLLRRADGSTMWALLSAYRMTFGGLPAMLAAITDISARKADQIALEEREQRLRAIADGIPLPIVIARVSQHEILFTNAHAEQVLGLTVGPEPETGCYLREEDRHALVERLVREGRVDGFEVQLRRRDASTMWGLVSARAITVDGRATMLTTVTDITERKAVEEALRASEARFQAFLRHAPVGMFVKDADGRYALLNGEITKIFGRTIEEMLGHTAADVLPRGLAARVLRRDREVLERGSATVHEDRIERPEGDLWNLVIRFPIRDGEGRVTHIGGFLLDISERKAVEERLQASEARYRAVVEGQSEFIIRQRPDGVLTFVNDAFCRFRGMTKEQILAGYNDLSALPDPARDEVLRQWAALTPERPMTSYDLRIDLEDGGVRWERWTDIAIFDPDGALVEYQSVGREITERKLAEEALRESEERLRTIAEGVPLPIVITRVDEPEVLFANALALEVFGLRIGRQPDLIKRIYVRPGDREAMAMQIERVGRVDNYELEIRRADGSTMWALMSARRMSYGGRPAVLGVAADVTELKATQQALRDSEARLAAFMDNAPVGMYLKDVEGRYILANPEMSKVFARPAHQMIGRTAADTAAAHDAAAIAAHDQEVLRTGQVSVVEEHTPELDAYRWDLVIRFPIRDASGAVSSIGGFDVDISERKAMEEALKASERQFRAFAESHPVPVVIARLEDSRIVFASPPFLELFRVTLDKLREGDLSRFYADPAERERVLARIQQEGQVRGLEVLMRRADGTSFWASVNSRLIEYQGRVAVVSGVVDITERKRAEHELELQRERLHQNEKMSALGSLLASVAHELNNPLSVVVGQAAMLQEQSAGTPTAARAIKIRTAADRCARIVKTFLAMARRRAPERSEVRLNDLVRAALDIAAYGLRSTGVEVSLSLDPKLPLLWADGDQLHQVLTNLIVNAKQALQAVAGPRRMSIATRRDLDAMVFEIADNGPGIPEEQRARIFDPFYTTKPDGVGTGIGLSVARRLVAAHGGRIEVGNGQDGGARFTVRLPLVSPPARAAICAPEPQPPRQAALTALVVDDEPDVAELLADILRLEGAAVDVVDGGRAALERLARQSYDLVISDLRMPDLDGPGLYRELQRQHPEMAQRMMFVTGDTLSTDAADFLAESGAPVIEKPFEAARIRQLAATHATRSEASPPAS